MVLGVNFWRFTDYVRNLDPAGRVRPSKPRISDVRSGEIRLLVRRRQGRGQGRHEGPARRQGREPRRDEQHRHPGPPGFTITTEVCAAYYDTGKKLPDAVRPQVEAALKLVETPVGKKFGDPADPLLVSVRSGAALSMPGMMNTILNLGLTDASVEGLAKKTGQSPLRLRRLPPPHRHVRLDRDGRRPRAFRARARPLKKATGVKHDTDLSADDLKELVKRYKAVYEKARRRALPAGSQGAALEGHHGRLQ